MDASGLKAHRLSMGLTQRQAAARVGLDLRQWKRYEAGAAMPEPVRRLWLLLAERRVYGTARRLGLVGEEAPAVYRPRGRVT